MAAEPLEHPWFRPGEPAVILALGRLVPQKDFGMLIRAFAQVRRARAARLLILGEGPERDGLAAAIAENGLQDDVQLPGWTVNPYPYMARSRLFVLSSRWEGLPTVLIEALFCGVEVVSTDCPSGPREILDGGRYGALVPVGDVDALAEAMERALSRDAARPGQESWLPFEQDVVAGRYLQTLMGT
jgi:glycosyltransferase involved in cell wall biosynthesis